VDGAVVDTGANRNQSGFTHPPLRALELTDIGYISALQSKQGECERQPLPLVNHRLAVLCHAQEVTGHDRPRTGQGGLKSAYRFTDGGAAGPPR
jgi:hypothetical protein